MRQKQERERNEDVGLARERRLKRGTARCMPLISLSLPCLFTCMEEKPRSSRMPSGGAHPTAASSAASPRKLAARMWRESGGDGAALARDTASRRTVARSRATGSTSRPTRVCISGWAAARAEAWPPVGEVDK